MTRPSHAQDWQTCLSEDVILAFNCGETTDSERAHIHEHADRCEHCRGLLLMAACLDSATTEAVVVEGSNERLATIMAAEFPLRTFRVGKRLANRFDILRFVERGGMGEVYEAFDTVLGSRVALKTLLATTSDSAQALERLTQEVSLARRVAHPHVCRIYDLHEHNEGDQHPIRFLAMEFIEGETLKDRLVTSDLTVSAACAIARQLLQGLAAVHAAGVLHLDFKSPNVMLRAGALPEQAVVMDFSLSRAFEKELRLRTSERQLAGSVGYMSPEQLECQPTLGPTSDVYAFGVVLFEMLTRRMPFEGESPASIMLKQLKGSPVPPSSLWPGISSELDALVLKCLSRQPRSRFQTVGAVLAELERCVASSAAPAPNASRFLPNVVLKGAVAIGVMLGSIAAIGHYAGRRADLPTPAEAELRGAEAAQSLKAVGAASVQPSTAAAGTAGPETQRYQLQPTAQTETTRAESLATEASRPAAPAGAPSQSAAGGGARPGRPDRSDRRTTSDDGAEKVVSPGGAPEMVPEPQVKAVDAPEEPNSEAPMEPVHETERRKWVPARAPDFLL